MSADITVATRKVVEAECRVEGKGVTWFAQLDPGASAISIWSENEGRPSSSIWMTVEEFERVADAACRMISLAREKLKGLDDA